MSSIAVFLVLGGASAYAAKKIGSNEIKGNSITTGKIKKNAITTAKIKKSAITTAKVKNGAITGPKVNLGTLGTVPNATHATTADTATNATNWSRYFTSGVKKTSVGNDIALATVGPFSITGRCEDLGGGEYYAWTFITTSQAGSFVNGEYYEADFNPGTEVEIGEYGQSTGPYWYDPYDDDDTGWTAASPSGSVVLKGLATAGVHVFGADCAFVVSGVNNA
jgi:hypothetical protein